MLLVLAIVPLVGASWFVRGELLAVERAQERADAANDKAAELVEITELRTRLLDERNWVLAEQGMAGIGIDPALVVMITGIDIPAEAVKAKAEVDWIAAHMSETSASGIAGGLATIRSNDSTDLVLRGERYAALETLLAERAGGLLDELLELGGGIDNGAELINAVRVLEASAIARQAISAELTGYFNAQFSGSPTASDDIIELIGQSALRRAALADIERIAQPGSVAATRLQTIYDDVDTLAFDQAVAETVESAVANPAVDEVGLPSLFRNGIYNIAGVFTKGAHTTVLYFDLVEGAGDDVIDAALDLRAAAERKSDLALAEIAVLTVASLLLAVAGNRAISRPLSDLADTAQRISEGRSLGRVQPRGGPIEVQRAMEAINDAALHLELAERQAKALAAGDLEHPALVENTAGALGTSLQRAVHTLAESLQEREVFRRRMIHEATHDSLTQLPNRSAALSHLRSGLARVNRSESNLAVLFIDLDGFKPVNDSLGHLAGDELLRITAQRLVGCVRDGDHVGRLGGDEFLVIAEPVSDVAEARHVAERLLQVISEPVELSNKWVTIGASIGVSMAADGLGASDLLRDADIAVYKAKAEGRGRVQVFDNALRTALSKEADLEESIRSAMLSQELELHFQPIVVAPTDATGVDRVVIGSFEALLRWNRPGFGMVYPDHFIPFAERSDLIVDLDRWVLMAAARQLSLWTHMADVPISVNVSARHLKEPTFVDDVLGPLVAHGVDPSRLTLEVTESALLDDLSGAADILQKVRNEGVRIAIDDFGTGYTSVAHLKALPLDIVKIDRTFTSDVASQSLVQLIIESGHLLGAEITAEGIETHEQAGMLAHLGADSLQGYLYGRPSNAQTVDDMVASGAMVIQQTNDPLSLIDPTDRPIATV